jgi:hypothetical protein
MKTNGSKPTPTRDQIIREATYEAARFGYYDTSEMAQKNNLLTITVLDMASVEPLPTNTTHKFFVCINATAYMVTRNDLGHYEVVAHDQSERHRQERLLRTAVLDYALWYLTGEGAGYHPKDGPEARLASIQELLGEHTEEEHEDGETSYPVVRDELPDIYLAPGSEESLCPRVLRQWSVQIGDILNYCEVGLIGSHPDGIPELVAVDA